VPEETDWCSWVVTSKEEMFSFAPEKLGFQGQLWGKGGVEWVQLTFRTQLERCPCRLKYLGEQARVSKAGVWGPLCWLVGKWVGWKEQNQTFSPLLPSQILNWHVNSYIQSKLLARSLLRDVLGEQTPLLSPEELRWEICFPLFSSAEPICYRGNLTTGQQNLSLS
jgi:hypothetical protein